MGWISLEDMQFFAYHGVHEQERLQGNVFTVELRVAYPFEETLVNDSLSSTLDYSLLYEVVAEVMTGPPRNLLERLALDIRDQILKADLGISALNLRISKSKPPLQGNVAASSVELSWPA